MGEINLFLSLKVVNSIAYRKKCHNNSNVFCVQYLNFKALPSSLVVVVILVESVSNVV